MSQNNLPATQLQLLAKELIVSELTLSALTATQIGWLKFEQTKRTTFDSLQRQELKVQELVNAALKLTNLEEVQGKLKEAREIAATAKEQRLHFTRTITEKLSEPSMEFERRNETLLQSLTKYELNLRKENEAKLKKDNALNEEKAQLRSHFETEHFRIAATYRQTLRNYVNDAYADALKVSKPADEIAALVAELQKIIKAEPLPKFQKFTRLLVDDDTAKAIFAESKKYNASQDLSDAVAYARDKFTMYDEDLANAAAALKKNEEQMLDEQRKTDEQIQIESATNTLIAQAGSTFIESKGTTVRRNMVVVEENTEQFALAVMAAFISNWNVVKVHLKVKTWSNLKIGQMATALAALHNASGTTFANIKFQEVEK